MTRFQKLAAVTVAITLFLVTIGVVVRATDSGLGCPDWPLCKGQLIPALGDVKAWLEWIHRDVAAVLGILILGLPILAWRDHRDRRSLVWWGIVAVVLVAFQAWLGEETVRLGNSGESVTAHLASAMALLGVLVFILARSFFPGHIAGRGGSQRFTLLAAFGAATTYALLLFGSHVTATPNAALVFPDWPLMGGTLFPAITPATSAQVLHRYIAAIVGVIIVAVGIVAWRTQRDHPAIVRLAALGAILLPIEIVVGGLQVLTQLSGWTQTLHVALGASIWASLVGLTVVSYFTARTALIPAAGGGSGGAGHDPAEVRPYGTTVSAAIAWSPAGSPGGGAARVGARVSGAGAGAGAAGAAAAGAAAHTRGDSVRAYIALTKPRIIELLLVTTVPAMVLATRQVPGIQLGDWTWLVVWTMIAGTLAAGSANSINCYLDRDIDLLMTRTRRRPLPAHEVEPDRAVVFGIVLGVISFGLMAWFVNLLAAFLTLLAIAFYVVVYTMILKRTTPQNIVIGGAAGALPPVIGWAAVTGSVQLPAILLFALVFYWTPPHFWALSLRIRKDYAAAGVPMLPVVRGIPETTRQIGLYTILLVSISLILWAVAHMGAIYLISAIVLGAIFLRQAYLLWRQGTSPERSTAQAIRLYKYSITYLSLLMLAVAIDALVVIPLG